MLNSISNIKGEEKIMHVKKWASLLLATAMLVTMFSGCGSNSQTSTDSAGTSTTATSQSSKTESSEPINLTFVNWGSAEDATKPAFDAMCAKFSELNPNVKIEQVAYPYNSIKDQLLIMSSGGNAPDIAQVKGEWVASLYNAGSLQPLDDLLPKETIDDYYPGLLEGTKYDGKIVSVPWAPSPALLYYNKTLMAKAGYNEPPKTWAELIEQATKISSLSDGENKTYGLGVSSKKLTGTGYFFLINMWQNGGDFVDKDGNVVINSEGNINAFTEIKGLIKNKVVPEGLEIKELRNLFAQGQLGFIFDVEVGFGIFDKGSPKGADFAKEYAATFVPGVDSAQGKTFAVEHQLVVFNDSKNKEMSAKLLDFLTGTEGISIYNENNGGKLPARKSVASLDFYNKPENQKLKPFSDSLSFATSLPTHTDAFASACEDIAEAIQRVSLNNEDPANVVKELDQKVKEKYSK